MSERSLRERPAKIAAEKTQRMVRKAEAAINAVKEASYQHGSANGHLSGAGREQRRIVEIIDRRILNSPHQTHTAALRELRAELTEDWNV